MGERPLFKDGEEITFRAVTCVDSRTGVPDQFQTYKGFLIKSGIRNFNLIYISNKRLRFINNFWNSEFYYCSNLLIHEIEFPTDGQQNWPNGKIFALEIEYSNEFNDAFVTTYPVLLKLWLEMCDLRHDNLCRYFAVSGIGLQISQERTLTVLMDDIQSEVSLHNYSANNTLLIDQVQSFTEQLLSALNYLHEQNPPFIICTLSTHSIFLTPSPTRKFVRIYFLDPVISLLANKAYNNQPTTGTDAQMQHFMSGVSDILSYEKFFVHPIILCIGNYPYKLDKCKLKARAFDIWSLGCVLLDMVTGGHLCFVDKNGTPIAEDISDNAFEKVIQEGGFPKISAKGSSSIKRLCEMCLQRDPNMQSPAEELLRHLQRTKTTNTEEQKQTVSFTLRNSVGEVICESYILLDRGEFGTVYAVMQTETTIREMKQNLYTSSNKLLALKILHNLESSLAESNEATLINLQHNNIIKYLAVGIYETNNIGLAKSGIGILMEYAEGGTLSKLVENHYKQNGKILEEKKIIGYLQQITSGVEYLHRDKPEITIKPIVHGDLKGHNIFLMAENETIKIGDLDNCDLLHGGRTCAGIQKTVGTIKFMSPETIKNEDESPIGRKTDIWSIGCIALEMINGGTVDYVDKNGKLIPDGNIATFIIKVVKKGSQPDYSKTTGRICKEFREIIESCLKKNSDDRPEAKDLLHSLLVFNNNQN